MRVIKLTCRGAHEDPLIVNIDEICWIKPRRDYDQVNGSIIGLKRTDKTLAVAEDCDTIAMTLRRMFDDGR